MNKKCYICSSEPTAINYEHDLEILYCNCHLCGAYIIGSFAKKNIYDDYNASEEDISKLKTYLYYHKEDRVYRFIGTEESYNNYKNAIPNSTAKLVTIEMVNEWYPKNFFEKVDYLMQYIFSHIKYEGDVFECFENNLESLLFYDINNVNKSDYFCNIEHLFEYYKKYLSENNYADIFELNQLCVKIQLSPKGLERVYELNKKQVHNKNVFIAMQFGEDNDELKAEIKKGAYLAGYNAYPINEKEYNGQIVPEILHDIEQCKFMIAEMSDGNKGVYYEAGYALGLGKEVIHICKQEVIDKGVLHFDVRQVNTIAYNDITEIPEKLRRRIEATIK